MQLGRILVIIRKDFDILQRFIANPFILQIHQPFEDHLLLDEAIVGILGVLKGASLLLIIELSPWKANELGPVAVLIQVGLLILAVDPQHVGDISNSSYDFMEAVERHRNFAVRTGIDQPSALQPNGPVNARVLDLQFEEEQVKDSNPQATGNQDLPMRSRQLYYKQNRLQQCRLQENKQD